MEIDVFNDGKSFVKLVETGGDELSIVNAARVSLHNESEWVQPNVPEWENPELDRDLSDKDKGLIKFLLKNKHGSPFEHNFMAFHIRAPIFVMREWVRHRIGFSINEESARYVELRPDFYIPDHIRAQRGKPGAYFFEEIKDKDMLAAFQIAVTDTGKAAFKNYKRALELGIAKEQARIVLPLNIYTEFRWTANARSLMNFIALRNEKNAMREIRAYGEALEYIFARQMPNVHRAFADNERIAP